MNSKNMRDRIVNMAVEMGADLAGIADLDILKRSPSHEFIKKIGIYQGSVEQDNVGENLEIGWPKNAQSALVIALSHPENEPKLDWWQGKGSLGNSKLIEINKRIAGWIEDKLKLVTFPMPYHIQSGGIFLKDAAVLAGLGIIGKNNMLVTPGYGPRVRLRAMLLSANLQSNGPLKFNPCEACFAPCRQACPQNAFATVIYHENHSDVDKLPSITGCYSRERCGNRIEMDLIEAKTPKRPRNREWVNSPENIDSKFNPVRYCRQCEFACPQGKKIVV